MTSNNINLKSVSGAIIPYTPPKSAEEFVNGEVVKKTHEIFEKAIHSHLEECKLLKTPDDLFLKWKYLTNTKPIGPTGDFFSILRNGDVLPSLFSFLDRNSLRNLSECSTDVKKDVDQYVDRAFEHYFGMSCEKFQELVSNLFSFRESNKMLINAIKKDAPEIVFEKFLSILFPKKDEKDGRDEIEFEEFLYHPLLKALENHEPVNTILSFLRAATRYGKICDKERSIFIAALDKRIATKELIEAILKVSSSLPSLIKFYNVENRPSAEVIETLLQAGVGVQFG